MASARTAAPARAFFQRRSLDTEASRTCADAGRTRLIVRSMEHAQHKKLDTIRSKVSQMRPGPLLHVPLHHRHGCHLHHCRLCPIALGAAHGLSRMVMPLTQPDGTSMADTSSTPRVSKKRLQTAKVEDLLEQSTCVPTVARDPMRHLLIAILILWTMIAMEEVYAHTTAPKLVQSKWCLRAPTAHNVRHQLKQFRTALLVAQINDPAILSLIRGAVVTM
jgi:hypothetical protein